MKMAFLLFLSACTVVFGDESSRIRRIAELGNIVHPEEIIPSLYIDSINYEYPEPEQNLGVFLFNNAEDGVLQIGLQSKPQSFDAVPPLNIVLLVDSSASMSSQIPRLKDSLALFMEKLRPADSLSLVGFNDTADVLFPASIMDAPEKKSTFIEAVGAILPQGGTNIEAGLNTAFEQALINLNENGVNAVIMVSDGTDLSARRREEGARSGNIRASLSWKNRNDLDLHIITPSNEHIYYGHKKDSTGGELDVDMNVNGESTEPIENIFWQESVPPVGTYRVLVQNYNFHGDRQNPTPFMLELKNGGSIVYFDGKTNGEGTESTVEVCSFQYSGDEQAKTFPIIERYKENKVSVSTLGIGDDFDAELMRALADESYGSSRFLANSEILMDIFGSDVEFERLAVPSARNLTIELEFLSGVEVLEADSVENRLSYNVPILNAGDYRTFLARYRLPAFAPDAPASIELVSLALKADQETIQEKTIVVTRKDPLAAYSSALLRFAENLKEIGEIFYQAKDKAASLQKTRESITELETAKQKLNKPFTDEHFILAKYIGILEETSEPRRSIMSTNIGPTSRRVNQ
jgi:Ca-activated chloride channel family protein